MGLRAEVHREGALEQVGVALPAADDLRGQRRRRPGVEHVGIGHEAAGLAALRLVEAGRRLRGRVDREAVLVGEDRVVVVRLAVGVEAVPDRERDAEEALARDQPVAVEAVDPVGQPRLHVAGDPVDLVAARDELLAQVGVAAAVGDVPLAGRDDLERLVAPLVEVGHALGRLRLAVEVAGLAQRRDRQLAGRERRLAGELGVALAARVGRRSTRGRRARMRPSRPMIVRLGSCSSRHQMTSVRSPNVQHMTMPEPLSISAAGCATTGTSTPNSGERTVRAEQ